MKYKIKVSKNKKYITAKVQGGINRELGGKLVLAAEKYGKKHNIKKVLIDLRESRNIDSIISNKNFSDKDFPDPQKRHFVKMAYFVTPGDNSHSFVIVSLVNAGYNAGMFTKEDEALEWLEEDITLL